jgi:hypothetical protein
MKTIITTTLLLLFVTGYSQSDSSWCVRTIDTKFGHCIPPKNWIYLVDSNDIYITKYPLPPTYTIRQALSDIPPKVVKLNTFEYYDVLNERMTTPIEYQNRLTLIKNLSFLWKQYKTDCYNDSTANYSQFYSFYLDSIPCRNCDSVSKLIEQRRGGQLYRTGGWFMCKNGYMYRDLVKQKLYGYFHKQPSFEDFMLWIEDKYKKE